MYTHLKWSYTLISKRCTTLLDRTHVTNIDFNRIMLSTKFRNKRELHLIKEGQLEYFGSQLSILVHVFRQTNLLLWYMYMLELIHFSLNVYYASNDMLFTINTCKYDKYTDLFKFDYKKNVHLLLITFWKLYKHVYLL